jgi:hypothetical protein
MKLVGFLRWQFQDWYKSAQFWAFSLILLALVAKLGSCPDPWPFRIMVVGIVISLFDTVVWVVKFQYHLYKIEQDRVARELSRK